LIDVRVSIRGKKGEYFMWLSKEAVIIADEETKVY
jgi:hypothetical protein